jgi:plasmid stability protein
MVEKCHALNAIEEIALAMLTVRKLSDEVHRALRIRAAQHGRSMEGEAREILESAVSPKGRVRLGSLLAGMGRQARLSDEEFAAFERVRDRSPGRSASFE